jgi:hypothetical protein
MPKYVTKDDFRNFTGIDLDLELRDKDDTSNKSNIFISQIENWCETYIQYHSAQKIEYVSLIPEQQEHFKRGILYQMEYVIRNSDISTDSGYNPETGPITDINYLERIALSNNAKMEFHMAGVWTRKMKSRYGFKYTDIY